MNILPDIKIQTKEQIFDFVDMIFYLRQQWVMEDTNVTVTKLSVKCKSEPKVVVIEENKKKWTIEGYKKWPKVKVRLTLSGSKIEAYKVISSFDSYFNLSHSFDIQKRLTLL